MAAAICRSRRAGRTDGDTETGEKDGVESVGWEIEGGREGEEERGGEEGPDEPAKLIMESSFWPYLT